MKPIATGIFMWASTERQSRRYGGFYACDTNFANTTTVPVTVDTATIQHLRGKRVKVWCRVIETRDSGHAGDVAFGIVPSRPEIGEIVTLGIGELAVESLGYDAPMEALILRPNDGRKELWIDPRLFFRLHDQSVEIFAEETQDDFTPAVNLRARAPGLFANDDGTFQFSGTRPPRKIHPKITSLGGGLFTVNDFAEGERIPFEEEDWKN